MELKDYFKNVGSDPCLVIDFHANAKMESATAIILVTEFGDFENNDKAWEFVDQFTKMLEKETETRQVVFRDTIVSAEAALSSLIGNVIVADQLAFTTNPDDYRVFELYPTFYVQGQEIKIARASFIVLNSTITFEVRIDLA